MEFSVIIKKGEKQFVALCPELDVVSQGYTLEDSIKNLKEAVEKYTKDELSAPKLTSHDTRKTYKVMVNPILISGDVDEDTYILIINEMKVDYTPGAQTFRTLIKLQPGENKISVQSIDKGGNKSEETILQITYTNGKK